MFAILFTLCQHTFVFLFFFFFAELKNSAARGWFIILSGGWGKYCMCVVTCGCCVLYQLNLTGWEGGRGEQRAWTPSPPPKQNKKKTKKKKEKKKRFLGEKMFIWRVCVRPPVEVTLYMNIRTSAECTVRWRGTSNCTFMTCLNYCNVRTLFLYNGMKFKQ